MSVSELWNASGKHRVPESPKRFQSADPDERPVSCDVDNVALRTMSCSNCERLRKEMEEMKEQMQLREFELEEKLNHLEDKVEWANEDKGNLKAELEDTIKELEKYKVLAARLGHGEPSGDKSEESVSSGTPLPSRLKADSVSRLLEIIRLQSELLKEMKELVAASGADLTT
ncbi:hypothetical protein BIW11_12656 [Tropilaelaps mercedesae]|uniref:Uncharacterized protein n=1 Tax=Tropilaelaps mercedesae TaxID=418985 RepID=A0A1V9X5E7_9ACAR|nr:hypothetical protein BIW11_12656 [Tropilaelaps mercedesae]